MYSIEFQLDKCHNCSKCQTRVCSAHHCCASIRTQTPRAFHTHTLIDSEFQGYKQEFKKIHANHNTRIEREELLRGSGIGASSSHTTNLTTLNRRDMYLKESGHLHG